MKLEATIGDKLILTDFGSESVVITTLTQRLENGIIYIDTIGKDGSYGNTLPKYKTVEELLTAYVNSWDKVEVMTIDREYNYEVERLLKGEIIKVGEEELKDIMRKMTKLNINTLSIQKSGWIYYIKVDELTVKAHVERLNNEQI